MRTRTKAAITILICVALVVAASFRIYAVIGGSGGYVLWNASEAFFFIEVSNLGYSANGIQYPWILFKKYVIGGFGVVESPTDQLAYLVVIRATSSGVKRHVLLTDRLNGGPGSADRFTPLEGRIYAFCPKVIGHFLQDGQLVGKDMNDGLCWWAGNHFEKATQDEQRRLDGINRLTKTDFENDEHGWSRRGFGAEPADRKFTITVGDKFRISVNNVAKGIGNSTVSIDLLRPWKAPERIGTFDAHEGRVSKSEYQHVFSDHE